MQVCSGVFTTQYHFLLVGKTLANMHPGWAIALSFIAAGWFGRRSFIRRDSTPTTYGNFWRGIKLVQIPNNAVCLNMHPKQKMMYIQLSWKICPKLLQSQAYSCTSVRIQRPFLRTGVLWANCKIQGRCWTNIPLPSTFTFYVMEDIFKLQKETCYTGEYIVIFCIQQELKHYIFQPTEFNSYL